ncbi:hypothetical protein PsAD13_00794 [Pseudovibrio sp. Ad13]|uniref:hypothetical protein n=1 Tax=unclassified Pseudovibrio TaxID=2627060 RepID=UPI0007AE56F7|nr:MULTISPECIES: hypothetical protein [unclassified Pseudovibrio]KZK87516.1 hypothetical protein PsAD13_00794 [Pseudovibrio sp. Ad13]KZK88834.1 hypothetical protein PsAD5_05184 [Pseudovibrio sp. Ad5]
MGRSPIHSKISQPQVNPDQQGATPKKTTSSHKGHMLGHAEPKNVHRLLDQLDELNGKSTKHSRPAKAGAKDPQLRPLAYHKHHKPEGEPSNPTDGMSRAAKKLRYEGYRLPPEKLMGHGASNTEASSQQSAKPVPTEAESPLTAHANTLDHMTSDPDLSDYVIVDTPKPEGSQTAAVNGTSQAVGQPKLETVEQPSAPQPRSEPLELKPHPAMLAMHELDLAVSPELEQQFQAYQEKKTAFINDPTGTAHEGPEAAKKQRLITGLLGMAQDKADTYLRMQFRTGLDNDARALAKQIFEDAAHDPRFLAFLKVAALAAPEDLSSNHKELLVFLSQNLKALNKEVVGDVNTLLRQNAFSKGLSEAVDTARAHAVTEQDVRYLNDIEKDVVAYRMATSKQLGEALNASNDLLAAMSFGDAILSSTESLSHENGRAQYALASLREVASQLTEQHLADHHSAKKTEAWIAKQPWAALISVSIQKDGGYYDINTELRHDPAPRTVGNSTFFDNSDVVPQQGLTKSELRDKPQLVLNGLRSNEMMEALKLVPTGEDGVDELPIVKKPSDLAMAWSSTLVAAKQRGDNISAMLPDYFILKQVRYHKIEGFLIENDMLEPAWVVEYKPTSHTMSEIGKMRALPQAAAKNLASLTVNLNELKDSQTKQSGELSSMRERLDTFLSTKGNGLLMSFGKAHFALDKLMEHVRDDVHARIEKSGGSLKKIQKWISEQPWVALFDVSITRPEGGKKSEYLISVKQKTAPEPAKPDYTTVTVEDPETQEASATAQETPDEFPGLTGSLRALLQPETRTQLILKPTGEISLGAEIVDKPSKLAREWGELLAKNSHAQDELPDFLELREVQYHSETRNVFRKGHLKTCWVLEFKPDALNAGRS